MYSVYTVYVCTQYKRTFFFFPNKLLEKSKNTLYRAICTYVPYRVDFLTISNQRQNSSANSGKKCAYTKKKHHCIVNQVTRTFFVNNNYSQDNCSYL